MSKCQYNAVTEMKNKKQALTTSTLTTALPLVCFTPS